MRQTRFRGPFTERNVPPCTIQSDPSLPRKQRKMQKACARNAATLCVLPAEFREVQGRPKIARNRKKTIQMRPPLLQVSTFGCPGRVRRKSRGSSDDSLTLGSCWPPEQTRPRPKSYNRRVPGIFWGSLVAFLRQRSQAASDYFCRGPWIFPSCKGRFPGTSL